MVEKILLIVVCIPLSLVLNEFRLKYSNEIIAFSILSALVIPRVITTIFWGSFFFPHSSEKDIVYWSAIVVVLYGFEVYFFAFHSLINILQWKKLRGKVKLLSVVRTDLSFSHFTNFGIIDFASIILIVECIYPYICRHPSL